MTEDEIVGWHHQLNGCEMVKDEKAWCASLGFMEVMGLQSVRHDLVTEQQIQFLNG